jgi:hypothetical protein
MFSLPVDNWLRLIIWLLVVSPSTFYMEDITACWREREVSDFCFVTESFTRRDARVVS